jgi:hypothetical protein
LLKSLHHHRITELLACDKQEYRVGARYMGALAGSAALFTGTTFINEHNKVNVPALAVQEAWCVKTTVKPTANGKTCSKARSGQPSRSRSMASIAKPRGSSSSNSTAVAGDSTRKGGRVPMGSGEDFSANKAGVGRLRDQEVVAVSVLGGYKTDRDSASAAMEAWKQQQTRVVLGQALQAVSQGCT